jgi:DNA polymerase III epsilon subunit-like protein
MSVIGPILPNLVLNNQNMRTITRRRNGSNSISAAAAAQLTDIRNKILVFDTETTGLYSIPRIIQIAYCKYYKTGVNHSQHSHYIRQLTDQELVDLIREEKPSVNPIIEAKKIRRGEIGAQAVHQIPWEIIHDRALPTLRTVLERFNAALKDVELIVGHNVDYDIRVVYNEARRVGFKELMQKMLRIPYVDTMKIAKNIVDARDKDGKSKMPNLGETFKKLFPDAPDVLGFHNAIVDVDVTARCFFRLMDKTAYPDIRINPGRFSLLSAEQRKKDAAAVAKQEKQAAVAAAKAAAAEAKRVAAEAKQAAKVAAAEAKLAAKVSAAEAKLAAKVAAAEAKQIAKVGTATAKKTTVRRPRKTAASVAAAAANAAAAEAAAEEAVANANEAEAAAIAAEAAAVAEETV